MILAFGAEGWMSCLSITSHWSTFNWRSVYKFLRTSVDCLWKAWKSQILICFCVSEFFIRFFFYPKIVLEVSSFFHVHNWADCFVPAFYLNLIGITLNTVNSPTFFSYIEISDLGTNVVQVFHKRTWMNIWILSCFGGVFFLQSKFWLINHICLNHNSISSLNSFRYLKTSLNIFKVEPECFK